MKTIKKLINLSCVSLALCLAQSASATDYHWTGTAGDGLWSTAGNWDNGVAVGPGNGAFLSGGGFVCTITNGEDLIVPDMVFGPEWGAVLNIYGTMHCGWYSVPVQWDAAGPRSYINMYSNSAYYAEGIGLGDSWWWSGGPYVTLNMYDNSFVGINWMFWGGRVNLYNNAVLSITNGLTVQTAGAVSDFTRSINLESHGTLVLPATFTATVNDWITRGILLVYGVPGDVSEIVIDEANTNWPGRTVVTTTATAPNPILAVRISVPRPNVYVGGVQQAQVYADYATTANVNITTVAGIAKTYSSSDTGVATITTGGLVVGTGVGTATLQVVVAGFTNTTTVTVSEYPNPAVSLTHRYSFSETGGTTAADSIGGTTGDGTYNGTCVLNGSQVELNGVDAYVQLPAGIITNLDAVTIETWASFAASNGNWSVLFTFGDTDEGTGLGHHYISCQPHTGGATTQTGISDANPGFAHEQNPWFAPVLDGLTNIHIAAVFHPSVGYLSIYTNGTLAAINKSITILLKDALATGSPLNYIGRSLYSGFAATSPDPYLVAMIDEFRIYNGPLSVGQIKANAVLGPNQFVGSNTSVSLTAGLAGGNVVLTWPTNSALVDLTSSPVLGSAAAWTSVSAGTMVIEGTNYKWTLPATGTAQYFRLKK